MLEYDDSAPQMALHMCEKVSNYAWPNSAYLSRVVNCSFFVFFLWRNFAVTPHKVDSYSVALICLSVFLSIKSCSIWIVPSLPSFVDLFHNNVVVLPRLAWQPGLRPSVLRCTSLLGGSVVEKSVFTSRSEKTLKLIICDGMPTPWWGWNFTFCKSWGFLTVEEFNVVRSKSCYHHLLTDVSLLLSQRQHKKHDLPVLKDHWLAL